jgi:Neuraminidase (sialidase)
VTNVILSASYDGGQTWSEPIQVNDNASAVDEFQPNLTVAAHGIVSNAFYDRRLPCRPQDQRRRRGPGSRSTR